MNNKKIRDLIKEIDSVNKKVKSLKIPEKVIEKKITSFGNGGHIVLPKKHLNKVVKVVIL